jgi:Tfp pilus assembly protein PilF
MTSSTMAVLHTQRSSRSLRARLARGAMMTFTVLAVVALAPAAFAEPAASKAAQSTRPQMKQKAAQAFKSGEKAFKSGDLKGAETQFKAAIAADSKAYLAHFALGVVQERTGNTSGAGKSYRAALDIVPDHEPSIVAYSLVLARQGKYDEAFEFVQKRPSSAGPSAALVAAKAEVRSLQGRSGEAQELAQQALKIDPNFKGAMVTLARDHYRARRIDLALYALTGILDGYGNDNPPRDKNNAEAHMLRGLIYAERNLRGPAMEEMEKALKERSDLVDAHLILANYMMQAGNAKDARPHLESAIRYDSRNVGAHLQLGDAYRLLGRPDDARRELEWVLKADPNQAAARYNLGLVFLLGGTLKGMSEAKAVDKAIEHFEAYKARAVRGGPDDVEELITRAKTKQAMLKSQQGQPAPEAESN